MATYHGSVEGFICQPHGRLQAQLPIEMVLIGRSWRTLALGSGIFS